MGVSQKNEPKIVAVTDDSSERVPGYSQDEDRSIREGIISGNVDHLQRRLGNRQIQLIASESFLLDDTAFWTAF